MDNRMVFNLINVKLGRAIMKPKNLKYKFLPFGNFFHVNAQKEVHHRNKAQAVGWSESLETNLHVREMYLEEEKT